MAQPLINFGKFQICEEVIQAVGEILHDEFLKAPDFTSIHTVYEGIVAKSKRGFWGEPAPVGRKRQDCNPVPQSFRTPVRTVGWDPAPWEILLAECFANLEDSIAVFALNKGVDIADLTNTDWATVLSELLINAMSKFFWRLFWFNDSNAAYFDAGGNISKFYTDSNGEQQTLDLALFNILDGFWVQIEAALADYGQGFNIAKNAGATYADQQLERGEATSILEELWFGGNAGANPSNNLQLRTSADSMLLVTQSLYDAYTLDLSEKCCTTTSFDYMINGIPVLKYQGKPLVGMPIWDEMIFQFNNTGSKLINPHRALLTTKSTLGVGVDRIDTFENFNMWYEKLTRETMIEAMGKADAKLMNPRMVRVAL